MASSTKASRRPRGLQKRHLFTLASLDASRNDFGGYLDLLGLDFGHFLGTMSATKLSPVSPKTACPSCCALHLSRHRFPDRSTVAEVATHSNRGSKQLNWYLNYSSPSLPVSQSSTLSLPGLRNRGSKKGCRLAADLFWLGV